MYNNKVKEKTCQTTVIKFTLLWGCSVAMSR